MGARSGSPPGSDAPRPPARPPAPTALGSAAAAAAAAPPGCGARVVAAAPPPPRPPSSSLPCSSRRAAPSPPPPPPASAAPAPRARSHGEIPRLPHSPLRLPPTRGRVTQKPAWAGAGRGRGRRPPGPGLGPFPPPPPRSPGGAARSRGSWEEPSGRSRGGGARRAAPGGGGGGGGRQGRGGGGGSAERGAGTPPRACARRPRSREDLRFEKKIRPNAGGSRCSVSKSAARRTGCSRGRPEAESARGPARPLAPAGGRRAGAPQAAVLGRPAGGGAVSAAARPGGGRCAAGDRPWPSRRAPASPLSPLRPGPGGGSGGGAEREPTVPGARLRRPGRLRVAGFRPCHPREPACYFAGQRGRFQARRSARAAAPRGRETESPGAGQSLSSVCINFSNQSIENLHKCTLAIAKKKKKKREFCFRIYPLFAKTGKWENSPNFSSNVLLQGRTYLVIRQLLPVQVESRFSMKIRFLEALPAAWLTSGTGRTWRQGCEARSESEERSSRISRGRGRDAERKRPS